MKTTLSKDDLPGWYLCTGWHDSQTKPLWWNGTRLYEYSWQVGDWPELPLHRYKSFGLLHTEADVAALNEELQTLRDQVASLQEQLKNITKYADMFQRADEEKLDELRKVRAEYDELFAVNQVLQFQVSTLTSDLEKAKTQPYEMRKAERPDCVGLWRNCVGGYIEVDDINGPCFSKPYYYLGPIPVIPVEQKPPQVVTVRHKVSGEVLRAIPRVVAGYAPSYCLLNDDGTTKCFVTTNSVEEVVQ